MESAYGRQVALRFLAIWVANALVGGGSSLDLDHQMGVEALVLSLGIATWITDQASKIPVFGRYGIIERRVRMSMDP